MSEPLLIRTARLADYESLVALFDELDEFHRRARPDFFRPFDGPARTREQIASWLGEPGSTVLVAEEDGELVGLALLWTRPPSAFAGAVPRKVIELDNLVVRADRRSRRIGHRLLEAVVAGRAGRARRTSRWACMPSTAMRAGSTRRSASSRRSTGWSGRYDRMPSLRQAEPWKLLVSEEVPGRLQARGIVERPDVKVRFARQSRDFACQRGAALCAEAAHCAR